MKSVLKNEIDDAGCQHSCFDSALNRNKMSNGEENWRERFLLNVSSRRFIFSTMCYFVKQCSNEIGEQRFSEN